MASRAVPETSALSTSSTKTVQPSCVSAPKSAVPTPDVGDDPVSAAKTVILGKVVPADGAELVWVLGEKDSLKSVLIEGNFQFDVRPGMYKLVVDAKQPYKDVMLDNLLVRADETLDVGEIVLKQ